MQLQSTSQARKARRLATRCMHKSWLHRRVRHAVYRRAAQACETVYSRLHRRAASLHRAIIHACAACSCACSEAAQACKTGCRRVRLTAGAGHNMLLEIEKLFVSLAISRFAPCGECCGLSMPGVMPAYVCCCAFNNHSTCLHA